MLSCTPPPTVTSLFLMYLLHPLTLDLLLLLVSVGRSLNWHTNNYFFVFFFFYSPVLWNTPLSTRLHSLPSSLNSHYFWLSWNHHPALSLLISFHSTSNKCDWNQLLTTTDQSQLHYSKWLIWCRVRMLFMAFNGTLKSIILCCDTIWNNLVSCHCYFMVPGCDKRLLHTVFHDLRSPSSPAFCSVAPVGSLQLNN